MAEVLGGPFSTDSVLLRFFDPEGAVLRCLAGLGWGYRTFGRLYLFRTTTKTEHRAERCHAEVPC